MLDLSGPPYPEMLPRTGIAVRPETIGGDTLSIGFDGHAEIVSLAEAEALAEGLQRWVRYQRFCRNHGVSAGAADD